MLRFVQQYMPNQNVLCHSHLNKLLLKPFSLSPRYFDFHAQKDEHTAKTVATKKRVLEGNANAGFLSSISDLGIEYNSNLKKHDDKSKLRRLQLVFCIQQ